MDKKIKQCPLEDSYRFRTHCVIKSCKNYSEFTKNKCLGLDTKFAADDKPITDAELLHYKFSDLVDSIREVTNIRKRAVNRARLVVILYKIVTHIGEVEKPERGFAYTEGEHPIIDRLLDRKPLRIKMLEFKPWMLKFLFDEIYVEKIVGDKFKVRQMLDLKTKEYSNIVSIVKH